LSNPGLAFIRSWLHSRFRVIASIDLPLETFVAFGGTSTQTSVLLLQRKTEAQMTHEQSAGLDLAYEVFMSVPRTMGFDRRGNEKWRLTDDGSTVWETVVQELGDGREVEIQHRV